MFLKIDEVGALQCLSVHLLEITYFIVSHELSMIMELTKIYFIYTLILYNSSKFCVSIS